MKLKKLLKDLPDVKIYGSKEVEVTGISANSNTVAPGNLFISKRGTKHDSGEFIPEAVMAGAKSVLTDFYDPTLHAVVQIVHPNPGELEPILAASFYEDPSADLFLVGVTGTSGKTTTSYLIKHLLDGIDMQSGLIGTVEYVIGKLRISASLTTPEAFHIQKHLREMVSKGCKSCAMEVSSHGLEQRRVDFLDYDVVVYTNLSQDHLDYHSTMDEYAKSKAKLFEMVTNEPRKKKKEVYCPKTAVINIDCPWSQKVCGSTKAKKLTYGLTKDADFYAEDIEFSTRGTKFTMVYGQEKVQVTWGLIGKFNVYNALAAAGVLLAKGVPLSKIAPLLKSFKTVPGRLEVVENPWKQAIYVDYAHKPDALEKVLDCLLEIKPKDGRIITVFGCGGDRDRGKRPLMAAACEGKSDLCVVTSDNPRSESPQLIIEEIKKGFKQPGIHLIEEDRRLAIRKALEHAKPKDIVLIAGKGHEKKQTFAHKTIEFDDCQVALEELEKLRK